MTHAQRPGDLGRVLAADVAKACEDGPALEGVIKSWLADADPEAALGELVAALVHLSAAYLGPILEMLREEGRPVETMLWTQSLRTRAELHRS